MVPIIIPPSLILPFSSYSPSSKGNQASKVGHVGVTLLTSDAAHNRVTGFDLLFPQSQYENYSVSLSKQFKITTGSLLLGRITNLDAVLQFTEQVKKLTMSDKIAFQFSLRFVE